MSGLAGRIGLSCALATPFTAEGPVDLPRMLAHASRLLEDGVDSVTLFGTTGEGASIGLGERRVVLGAFGGAGIPSSRILAGVSAASADDAIEQARVAYAANCRAILMAPAFYFPEPGDDGLFDWFSAVFRGLGGELRDILLYNIPSMTRATITPALMARLRAAFPGAVLGVKDSSGDWNSARAFLEQHRDAQVLVGDESLLARCVREGGSGTICGLANLGGALLRSAAHEGRDDPRIVSLIRAFGEDPFLAGIKALIASRYDDEGWLRMRPPMTALTPERQATLAARATAALAAKAA